MTNEVKLTDKQELFCIEYLVDLNAAQAAIRAGYSEKTARAAACRLLTNVYIQDKIAILKTERMDNAKINAQWVLDQAVKVHIRCMQGEPIFDKDGGFSGEWKFEHAGANKALEIIGKHIDVQAFSEKVVTENTHTVKETLAEKLKRGSKR